MYNELLEKTIDNLSENDKIDTQNRDLILSNFENIKHQKLNILFVGATGVGKSSTINAIFNTEIAKVGYSVDPETSTIQKYELDNIVLWDTPGLGDNPDKDIRYAIEIANALKAKDSHGNLIIDEVVVVIDGSNRDLRTTYEIIENLIAPYIDNEKRIIIAINQCDIALKGRYWNHDEERPDSQLLDFLEEKVTSVKARIKESTNIETYPIYYSALHNYNISKLLLTMIRNLPDTKRYLFADSLNKDPEVWRKNDSIEHYNAEIQEEVKGSLTKALEAAAKGAASGAAIGNLIPVVGPAIGAAIGAVLGFLGGLME